MPVGFTDVGALTSGDSDVFRLSLPLDGTLHAYLEDLTNPEDDFALSLTDSGTAVEVAVASSSSGYASLAASVDGGTTCCLTVSGSEGDDELSTSVEPDAPVVTGIFDSSGASVTSASRGDTLTIEGTSFIPVARRMEILFGGVRGQVGRQ